MDIVNAGVLAKGLVRGLQGSREDWGSETELLCQFYELVGKAFEAKEVTLLGMSPELVACTLETQLDRTMLTLPERERFVQGLELLRTTNVEHFRVRLQ